MRAEEIRAHLRLRPFCPIRFHLSDGSSYDVRHPELALVTSREVIIALGDGGDRVPPRSIYCDPLHVTRIEPISGD